MKRIETLRAALPRGMGALLLAAAIVLLGAPASAQKYGGVLNALSSSTPPSLSLHEEATIATNWVMMPAYNNIVIADPFKPIESLETIIPELAEKWTWSNGNKDLTFTLHKGVKWHDGKAFTAQDVKTTFDVVRGASTQRLKINPRKVWYSNVQEIVTKGDYEVTFKLKRPQPSVLAMFASGYSAVYPAHIPFRDLRTTAMGTGPFVFKEYKGDQAVIYEKNPNYFVKGRPYLDGIKYQIILARTAQIAAVVTKTLDIDSPSQGTRPFMEQLKSATNGLIFTPTTRLNFSNVHFTMNKPPWNNPKLRQVVSLALDRDAMIKSVFQGGAQRGGANLPPPDGNWGLPDDELRTIPGYGDPAKNKEQAREIMRSLGYGENHRLKYILSTRTSPVYVDPATYTIAALKDVYMDGELKQYESGQWYGVVSRRDYAVAVNSTGVPADDPDVNFYENFTCNSIRNYSDYCVPEVERMIDAQSQEFDTAKRKRMVWDIDKRLMNDGARIIYAFRINYNSMWPHVKDFVPHANQYGYGRMQNVWLDK